MKRMTGWVRTGDINTFFWINRAWKCGICDAWMPVVTQLGSAVFCVVLTLALLLSGDALLHQAGVSMAISLLLSHAVVAVCKRYVVRRRPYQVLADVFTGRELLQDASFPSGHSTAAFCMATVLSLAFPEMVMLYYGLATCVAASRVYLGMHYPSDLAMGAALGTFTAWLFV